MDKNFKKNFLKGSFATSVGQISSISLHFVSTILIVRNISKSDFGIFSLMLVISILLTTLAGLGLNAALIKYVSSNEDIDSDQYIKDLTTLRFCSLIVISIIYVIINLFTQFIDSQINLFVVPIVAIFIISSLREFYYAQLQGLRRFKELAFVQFSSALVKFIAIIFGVALGSISITFLIATEIGALLISFVIQQFLVPVKISFSFKLTFSKTIDIIRFSYPLYFNNLLAIINNRTNAFIITGFSGPISFAYYEVAAKIPDALNRVYNSFILVLFPNLSYLVSKEKKNDAHDLINVSIQSINLLLLPILMTVYIFQEEIVSLLFTEQYIESAFALFLFMIAFYFSSVASITGYSLVALNKNILSFKSNLFGVIIGVSLSLILTPFYSFNGAVIGVISARLASSLFGIYYLKKQELSIRIFTVLFPLLYTAGFILVYEIIRMRMLHFKVVYISIFILITLILFKDFRNVVFKIVQLVKNIVPIMKKS